MNVTVARVWCANAIKELQAISLLTTYTCQNVCASMHYACTISILWIRIENQKIKEAKKNLSLIFSHAEKLLFIPYVYLNFTAKDETRENKNKESQSSKISLY
jgi:hypothetical protein